MTDKVSRFQNRREIEQEALEWLIRMDGDDPLGPQELEALREWLGRSQLHREELNSLNEFWSNNVLAELVVPLGRPESPAGSFTSAGGRRWLFGGVVTAAIAGMWLIAHFLLLSPARTDDGNRVHVTAVGQQKHIALADGSRVQLNTNSQISVAYDDRSRNIHLLSGEAHFEVAGNSDRPFRVYAGAGRVQAMGTAFTVFLTGNALNVLVAEGQVALAALGTVGAERLGQSQELGTLNAGESITLDLADGIEEVLKDWKNAKTVVNEEELYRRESWREGLLVFSGEPLEQVIQEISRYTTLKIEIADADLRQIQIGGRFRVGEIDRLFGALEANFGMQVQRIDYDHVRLDTADRPTGSQLN